MPVFVNKKQCLDREHCFAAAACPYDAFYHNSLQRTWEVDAAVCGDCPGPCMNFCDQGALRWGDDLVDLKLVKAELAETMKPAEVAEARLKHKEERKAAAEEAKKKSPGGVVELTRANFEQEVLRSALPVAVDCWATWCGPCKQFSPIFAATVGQYAGVLKFARLDTDAEPALARGLGVQALPTTLLFYKGQLVNAVEGALPAGQFQSWIYQTLTALRQYETQLQAEANSAISAASLNLAALDSDAASSQPSQGTASNTGSNGKPATHNAKLRGKKTTSGLYIP